MLSASFLVMTSALSWTILAMVAESSLSYPAALVLSSQARQPGIKRYSVRDLFHELRSINRIIGDEAPAPSVYDVDAEDELEPRSLVFNRRPDRFVSLRAAPSKRSWFHRSSRELHLPSLMEELASSMGQQSGDQASKFVRFAVKGKK